MNTFVINKNNVNEIYKMCCLYADHHKREAERLKWQNKVLEDKFDKYFWAKLELGSQWEQRARELNDWWEESKQRYNKIADAYHLALHVASLVGRTTFPQYIFEEMHVNSVDMEIIVAYAYKHGNK